MGDINTDKGDALARELRKETGKDNVHFVHCDVTDWQSQVNLFKEAVKLSPHGGIDTVVANAGIISKDPVMEPQDLSVAEPKKPVFKTMEVNCTAVFYTTHLAYYWLPRNPGSKDCSLDSHAATQSRDRHLLLLGSVASLAPIAGAPQYGAAKHAVLGLFRSLRASTHLHGVRVNMVCPYFVETGIVEPMTRLLLAGGGLGKVEDVVDAATRFVADSRILGRALVVAPKASVKQDDSGEWIVVDRATPGSSERALWEPYADDWYEQDPFNRNVIRVLSAVQAARGWTGWATDMAKAIGYALGFGR
jgi:NAD(P)-dependent dehydrogenase (short-subunit alcohol dehydrogenase family)